MDVMKWFNALCLPSKVNFVLALLFIVSALFAKEDESVKKEDRPNKVGQAVMALLWAFVWAWVLNYICKNFSHGNTIAWVLVIAPYVLVFLLIFGVFFAVGAGAAAASGGNASNK